MTEQARGGFRAGVLQVNALNDMQANIDTARTLVRRACDQGAQMLFMPENVAMMEWGRTNIIAKAAPEADHPALAAFRQMAEELSVWLHCGTLAVLLPNGMVANRTYVLDSDGGIAARYDKIHMFDVDLGNGESYRESATFQPGEQAVVVDLPWCRMGLAVCYDIRFPHLFRTLAQAGADVLTAPAAFTRQTGAAHWHVLQRARAIETGCWMISSAQTGTHLNNRETYGHALVVAPWGEVIADAGTEVGVSVVDIDLTAVDVARGKVPSLRHDRAFGQP
ncbi:carbon-nitrogen hydrolase family protein [Insolitispirillum peregrinum]|uniref:Predicted amidohydrolase n=1 Tax=Insolitispirillum peregrinum TaxID=80876 RepID=A0A1N7LM60_9PROT|nr:carbon-nitrogen hydrolase family protein [Insolitispirillum peregrinum]SIS74910.1 Predicted amidohydrolase [Insolitispirillum peregrinum]